jgi:hypothetical protein
VGLPRRHRELDASGLEYLRGPGAGSDHHGIGFDQLAVDTHARGPVAAHDELGLPPDLSHSSIRSPTAMMAEKMAVVPLPA